MWWLVVPWCIVTVNTATFSPETLYSREVDHGGFGGPVVKLTQIGGRFGVLGGVRGAWIIDHRLALGGGIYGMASQNTRLDPGSIGGTADHDYRLEMGYLGLEVEYVSRPHRLVHLTVHALVGGGGAAYIEDRQDGRHDDDMMLSDDGFFVVEPGVNLEVNVAGPLRIALGASYRFASDVDLQGMTDADFSGFSTCLALKFGRF